MYVAISPEQSVVATGGLDSVLSLYKIDLKSRESKLIHDYNDHQGYVSGARVSVRVL